jgi:hypothetical protein
MVRAVEQLAPRGTARVGFQHHLRLALRTFYDLVRRRFIFNVDCSPLRFHQAGQVTVRDNTLVVASEDTPPLRYNNTNPETIQQIANRVLARSDFDPTAISPPKTEWP